jgi:hypothetical protein
MPRLRIEVRGYVLLEPMVTCWSLDESFFKLAAVSNHMISVLEWLSLQSSGCLIDPVLYLGDDLGYLHWFSMLQALHVVSIDVMVLHMPLEDLGNVLSVLA